MSRKTDFIRLGGGVQGYLFSVGWKTVKQIVFHFIIVGEVTFPGNSLNQIYSWITGKYNSLGKRLEFYLSMALKSFKETVTSCIQTLLNKNLNTPEINKKVPYLKLLYFHVKIRVATLTGLFWPMGEGVETRRTESILRDKSFL